METVPLNGSNIHLGAFSRLISRLMSVFEKNRPNHTYTHTHIKWTKTLNSPEKLNFTFKTVLYILK